MKYLKPHSTNNHQNGQKDIFTARRYANYTWWAVQYGRFLPRDAM